MKNKYFLSVLAFMLFANFSFAQESNSVGLSVKKKEKPDHKGKTAMLVLDTVPPDVKFTYPRLSRGFTVVAANPNTELRGVITDRTGVKYFKINGLPVQFDKDGAFVHMLRLEEGNQTIMVEAMDNTGHYMKEQFTIEHKPEVKKVVEEVIEEEEDLIVTTGKYYALIIGIDEYPDISVNSLDNPIRDAQTLYDVLVNNYTFNKEDMLFLKNSTRSEIIDAFDKFAGLVQPDDNFLLFYAGHGYWNKKVKLGYWLPSDSKQGKKANWLPNSTLKNYLQEINSKHTLLIADACFAGGIFKTRSAFNDAPASINLLYELPSRKAMTSGTMTEVPDESAFIKYLVRRLKQNKKRYLSSEVLFSSFREVVSDDSGVLPQYGKIKNVGDDGGDFIFIKK